MGSRPKNVDLAYIAGFLDGDGSLMIQIKKRSDSPKTRIMLTICFYQDKRHEKTLFWIQKVLKSGYISRRRDNITELRINGFERVENILLLLLPFIKFKRIQAERIIDSAIILQKRMGRADKLKLIRNILAVQSENYASRKKDKKELYQLLGLTP